MDFLKLDSKQKKIVIFYAYYNRVHWLCENGIKFNDNTSEVIDWDKVNENKRIINDIYVELSNFK